MITQRVNRTWVVPILFGGRCAMANFEVYLDKSGQWRWRFRANNGRIVADSGEGYMNKKDCEDGARVVKNEAPYADIVQATS
jgi:uncharacterized protein YegP (UPF0339 family)